MKNNVAERLHRSKNESNAMRFELGRNYGRCWAEDDADADDLERLARTEGLEPREIGEVACLLDLAVEHLVGDLDDVLLLRSPHFAEGVVTEALVVLAEHFQVFEPTA